MSNGYIQRPPTGGGGGGGANTIVTQDGSATTIADTFIFSGYDIPDNDINGIVIRAGAATHTGFLNQVDVDITNRFHGALTTTDAATHTIATLPIPITNGVTRLKVFVVGYNLTGNIAATTEINASYRTTGGVNTLLSNNYFDLQEDLAFIGSVFTAGTTPGSILVEVSGQVGNTIEWVCVGTYVQVGS